MTEYKTLRGITGNRGNRASHKDILRALEGPHGEPVVDFATICEMRDQQRTLDLLDKSKNWEVYRGRTRAEVVVLNVHTMKKAKELDAPLLLPAGRRPRFGGKYNTAKIPTGIRVQHDPSDRWMDIWCLHNIQSVWMPGRRAAALEHNKRFVNRADPYKRLTIAGMDANAEPGDRSMKPFRDERWKLVFPTGTFKKPRAARAIDGFAVDDRDVAEKVLGKPKWRRVNVNGTDHFWLRVDWPISVAGS